MNRIISNLILALLLVKSFSQITFYDKSDFENPCDYLFIDSSASNQWRIGEPGGTYFNTTISDPNAIITDAMGNYSPNTHSMFTLKLPQESFGYCKTDITFWHTWQTDTINDYGVVEVSYDQGLNWTDLCTDTTYVIYFERNGNANANHLATGPYNGWYYDYIYFWWYLVPYLPQDHIWVRFSFYSDSIQNEYEGWLIDDIEITSTVWSSISEHQIINSTPFPVPCQDHLTIKIKDSEKHRGILYIFDNTGHLLESGNFENESIHLNTDTYKNGIYYYKLIFTDHSGISQGKFIVSH